MTKETEALKWLNSILPEYMKTEHLETIRRALAQPSGDVEALVDDIECIIADTHDIDVTNRHYAQNIADYLAAQGYLAPQWQPIETAPVDGSDVLIASYIVPSDFSQENGSKPFWDIAIGCCYSRSIKDNKWTSILGSKPTHWMPLPAAPKKEGE